MILNNLLKIFILIENWNKLYTYIINIILYLSIKTMNKKLKIIILACLAIIIIIFWILMFPKKLNQHMVSFENKTFQVELAQTDEERQKWLMNRKSLDEDKWMLFIFSDEWIHTFWMKNTLIPLDMIRINSINWENRVVDIQTAEPCVTSECEHYKPAWDSLFVLEINAWLAKKYGIEAWDLVYIE